MEKYCINCMRPLTESGICPACGFENQCVPVPMYCLPPGTVLNRRYLLGRVLGQGGFGITYVGLDTRLSVKVAVKEYFPVGLANRNAGTSFSVAVLQSQDWKTVEDGKKKFLREAQILAGFYGISGIVSVRDYFEANRTAYIIMEYLDGEDLNHSIQKSLFPAAEPFAPFLPVMDALENIHREGVIHRDISPDNIMRLTDGSLKLMDFGAARVLDYSSQKSVSIMLKEGYTPPEQYRSRDRQGPWTDIYSLSATVYKCVTGITPDDVLERLEADQLRWPSELGFSIPIAQENVLKKGLSLRQEDRFQSIGEMKAMLGIPSVSYEKVEKHCAQTEDQTVYFPHHAQKGRKEHDSNSAKPTEDKTFPHPHNSGLSLSSTKGNLDSLAEIKFSRQHLPVLCAAAACVFLLMLTAVSFFWKAKPAEILPPVYAETWPPMYHVTVTPLQTMEIGDYALASEILRDRLEIFAGKDSFSMKTKEEEIDLMLPKEAFGNLELEKVFSKYLSCPAKLFAVEKDSDFNAAQMIHPLSRSDLERVFLQTGITVGAAAAEYAVTETEYPYLTIVLSEDCVQRMEEDIVKWGENFCFTQDLEYDYCTLPAGDGKTFYILNDDSGGRWNDILLYNFTHDTFDPKLSFHVDINSRTDWQYPDETIFSGTFQCGPEDFTKATVSFILTGEKGSRGQIYDTEDTLKKRLDTLEIPYAFGLTEGKSGTNFTVRTSLSHMGRPIMETIGSNSNLFLQGGLNRLSLDNHFCEFSCLQRDDGTFEMIVSTENQQYQEQWKGLSKKLAEQGGGKLFLTDSNYVPYFETDVTDALQDGMIHFSELSLSKGSLCDTPLDETSLWIINLILSVKDSTFPVIDLHLTDYEFYAGMDGQMPEKSGFEFFYPKEMDILSSFAGISKNICGIITQGESSRYIHAEIYPALDVDEMLPEHAAEIAKSLYYTCDFLNSCLDSLDIYLIDEDARQKERGRMSFQKSYASSVEGDGYICVSGIFTNGRLDRYKKRFQEILQTDAFYQNLTKGEDSIGLLMADFRESNPGEMH